MGHPIDILLGEKVRSLRMARAMQPGQVGAALDISPESVEAIEAGRNRLNALQLIELAELFEIRAEEFLHHVCTSSDVDPRSGTVNVFSGLDGDSLEFAYLFSKIENKRHRDAVMRLTRSLIDDPTFNQ